MVRLRGDRKAMWWIDARLSVNLNCRLQLHRAGRRCQWLGHGMAVRAAPLTTGFSRRVLAVLSALNQSIWNVLARIALHCPAHAAPDMVQQNI